MAATLMVSQNDEWANDICQGLAGEAPWASPPPTGTPRRRGPCGARAWYVRFTHYFSFTTGMVTVPWRLPR